MPQLSVNLISNCQMKAHYKTPLHKNEVIVNNGNDVVV